MHCCSFMKGLEALAGRAYTRLITAASSQCLLSRARNIPLLHFGYTFRNFRIIIIPCNFLKLLLSINCISLIRRTKEISIFASRVGNVERCESDDYSIRLSNIVSRIFIYNYRRIREDDVSLLKLKYPGACGMKFDQRLRLASPCVCLRTNDAFHRRCTADTSVIGVALCVLNRVNSQRIRIIDSH